VPFAVELIEDAERDILDIYTYILEHDSREAANHVFGELEKLCSSLAELPQRGHVPPELSRINVTAFLEVHFKPYRILYEIDNATVYIHCVLDGRRDLTTLLERRLLR
jgi:toxin ParE1/3/4